MLTPLTLTGARAVLVDPAAAAADGSGERAGDVHLADGVVVAATPDGAERLDVSGCVVTPGLVNAHHHLLQSAFRTLPGTRGVPMARWLPTMAAAYAAAGVDDDLCAVAAGVGLAESLLCGVTTVADHHLTWPADASVEDTVAMARATVGAAEGLGARLVLVRGTARDDPERAAASADAIATTLLTPAPLPTTPTPDVRGSGRHSNHDLGRPGGGVGRGVADGGWVQVAVGPAGVHSDGEATFRLLAEVAARHGLRRRTQANEQVDVAVALERYGRRPVDLLAEWGWLAPDVTLAHLCGVDDGEIARLAAAGVTATHAPGCDLPMGWGVAPVAALRDAGIAVGLGTSGGGSNDAGHLLADARLAMQVAPLAGRPLAAREALALATSGSAAGLGRAELGHLRPGAAADLCVWDTSGVADAGVADPVAGLLWAGPGRRPRHVVVGGRVVVRDGVLQTADERDLVAALDRRLARGR